MNNAISIKQIMTPNPVTLKVTNSLYDVVKIFKKYSFAHLPVIDADDNLVGIISKTDVYRRALDLSQQTTGKSYSLKVLQSSTTADVMTLDPVTVNPDSSIDDAIEILVEKEFHALPVTENGKIVGIVSLKDLLEHVINSVSVI